MSFMDAALNHALTTNGMSAFRSTLNPALDLFGQLSAFRAMKKQPALGSRVVELITKTYQSNPEVAVRLALYIRDVKQGAGERDTGRMAFRALETANPELAIKLIPFIVEFGRWDDLLSFKTRAVKTAAYEAIWSAILEDQNALAAKWMPRRGDIAEALRVHAKLTKREYRQVLVSVDRSVEQLVYAGLYDRIVYEHLPAKAIRFHHKRFLRHDGKRYQAYLDSLEKGEVKVKATGMTPLDVWPDAPYKPADAAQIKLREAQWKALPNFVPEGTNILPMIDVSGSMQVRIPGTNDRSVMGAAIMIGMYVAERQTGAFKDAYLTFHTEPKICRLSGTSLCDRITNLSRAPWGGTTNLQAAFEQVLQVAVRNRVPVEDMPSTVLILSDMQFDQANRTSWTRYGEGTAVWNPTAIEMIRQKYAAAGYPMPKVVFWNLNTAFGSTPVTQHETGAALISGYSASIIPAVMSDQLESFTPLSVMMEALSSDRYDAAVAAVL